MSDKGWRQSSRRASYTLVYDTGPALLPKPRMPAAASSRRSCAHHGLRRADGLIVSHQDLDHSGGALSLMQATPIGWLASSLPADHPIIVRAQASARAITCMAGQQWTWDDVRFTVLHPTADEYAGCLREDQRPILRRSHRFAASAARCSPATSRRRPKRRSCARVDTAARRCDGRAASRIAHVVDARVRARRRAGDRRSSGAAIATASGIRGADIVARYTNHRHPRGPHGPGRRDRADLRRACADASRAERRAGDARRAIGWIRPGTPPVPLR